MVRQAATLADLGSGAGFPGLPLAIALPDAHVSLVESVGRKAAWLEEAVASLGLANVEVVAERAEAWPEGLGRQDVVTARALGALPVLLEYASPLLRDRRRARRLEGRAQPGRGGRRRRGRRESRDEAGRGPSGDALPASRDRHLHVYEKLGPTPEGFPRAPGRARKRPIGAVALALGGRWELSTRWPTRRAAWVRRRPRSTSAPAWPRPASRTLLIDVDPQGNATVNLGLGKDEQPDSVRRARG